MQPNFFLVGAHKSGTTALYAYLGQHPDIFLSSRKEPQFFVPEFRAENVADAMRKRWEARAAAGERRVGRVGRWEDYLELFRGASTGQAVGEGSVGYLWSPSAARLIHERIPEARILMILRDPADRAFSHYNAMPEEARRLSFGEQIRRSAAETPTGPLHWFNPFLDFGLYAAQVTRYLERFGEERVRIFLHDDFVADREALVRAVFEFLDVEPDVPLDLSRRHNETRVGASRSLRALARPLIEILPRPLLDALTRAPHRPRNPVRMPEADRRLLVDYYAADIRRLQALIGRDLSGWLATG